MAMFNAEGIDGLMLSLQEFQEIPDDVLKNAVEAQDYEVKEIF